MTVLNKIYAITINTFKEKIRDRILFVILAFAIFLIISSVLLARLSILEQIKIITDLGLSAISIFGSIMAIFLGIGLVSYEIERKTIYNILSKPVKRSTFIIGKFLGLLLVLILNVCCMSIVHLLTLSIYGVKPTLIYIIAIYFTILELTLVIAISLFFSTFSSTILSSICALSLYIVGHTAEDMKWFGAKSQSKLIMKITDIIYYILPNLEFHNLRVNVTYDIPVSVKYSMFVTLYSISYSIVLLIFAAIIFSRRELK